MRKTNVKMLTINHGKKRNHLGATLVIMRAKPGRREKAIGSRGFEGEGAHLRLFRRAKLV